MRKLGSTTWRSWSTGSLPLLLLTACVSSSNGTGAGSGGASDGCDAGCWAPSAADQAFVASVCTLAVNCCTSTGIGPQATMQGCISAMMTQDYSLSSDATLQAACLAELQSLAGTSSCVPDLSNFSDPCLRVYDEPSGPQQPGEPCTRNRDCAGSPGTLTVCAENPTNGPPAACLRMAPGQAGSGTCLGDRSAAGATTYAAYYNANAGMPPVFTGYFCAARDGLYCDVVDVDAMTTPTCEPLGDGGAPCHYGYQCVSQICQQTEEGALGTCVPIASIGEACASSTPQGAVCDDATYCYGDGGSATCVPRLPPGAPCSGNETCASNECECVDAGAGVPCSMDQCAAQSDGEQLAMITLCGQFP